MKKVLAIPVIVVITLFLLTGCMPSPPGGITPPGEQPSPGGEQPPSQEQPPPEEAPVGNNAPTAYIDAITPPIVSAGEEVTLHGHGIDTDGAIVAYRWRSSLDGPLGVNPSITTTELSVGEHDIYFKVQDNNGAWSMEVSDGVIITPEEPPVPLNIASFTADPDTINLGDTATLSWEIAGAVEVTIEPGIGLVDQVDSIGVSPEETTDYIVTATRGSQTKHSMARVTVVLPNSYSEVLTPVPSETSGIFDGSPPMVWPPGAGISVGDYSTNLAIQGFASFDVSAIPADATITGVEVDFSSYSTGDTPFADLGCLRVYPQHYEELGEGDFFTGTPTGALMRYCSEAAIMPYDSESFLEALQDSIGHDRFQIRFQFNEVETDNNGDDDYIHWDNNELILNVEYDSYQ